MGNFLMYLLNRLIFRIANFIRHWYVESFKVYTHFIISVLEKLDRFFAVKITYRHLFSPLYQDRSIFGYFFGFIFRIWRLFFGGIFYVIFIVIAIAVFLIWVAIPLFIIYKIAEYSPVINVLKIKN